MGWLFYLFIAASCAVDVFYWRECRRLQSELDAADRRHRAEIDGLLRYNDTLKQERDEAARKAGDWGHYNKQLATLESRCTELQRIIDDYRRWIRESVKLMPDSVKHVSDIQLVERHRPRPATEGKA